MSDLHLVKTRMRNGTWEGVLTAPAAQQSPPDIKASCLDRPVEGIELTRNGSDNTWDLRVPVPAEAVSDGVQTVVIFDASDDTKLGDFSVIAGEAFADDLRAEVELLRAELDMLKRAFRRHCLETM